LKKNRHETELVKKALAVGALYVKKRGYGEIDTSDSHNLKVEYIYRALVEDKLVQPLAKKDISIPNMEHKLALWITRQLPADHPLLNQH
jgi:hypothetical protein